MSSSTAKRSGRTTLRNFMSGGRKGKDKDNDNGGSMKDSNADDPSVSSNTSSMYETGATTTQQPTPTDRNTQQRATPTRQNTSDVSATVQQSKSNTATTQKTKEKSSRTSNGNEMKSSEGVSNVEELSPPQARGRSGALNSTQSGGGNMIQRLRERSRSRSRTRAAATARSDGGHALPDNAKELLVAVTSCRSDGYYSQKAPGSISKLPRKAPTNLKLFHELAVGVKDAYSAVGATPRNPSDDEKQKSDKATIDAKVVLWDFIGNLDFVCSTIIVIYLRL
jgi:hypothetical protein